MIDRRWMQHVQRLINEAGCRLVDLDGWDWQSAYDENYTPEEAADESLRDRWYMNESDLNFYDYMACSDADPGL